MTKFYLICIISAISFLVGFFLNDFYRGYGYKLYKEKRVNSDLGVISVKHFSETVGFSFLDPGKSSIELEHYGINIYNAPRMFQESHPLVKNIYTNGNLIQWNDGLNIYKLNIIPTTEHSFNPFIKSISSKQAEYNNAIKQMGESTNVE